MSRGWIHSLETLGRTSLVSKDGTFASRPVRRSPRERCHVHVALRAPTPTRSPLFRRSTNRYVSRTDRPADRPTAAPPLLGSTIDKSTRRGGVRGVVQGKIHVAFRTDFSVSVVHRSKIFWVETFLCNVWRWRDGARRHDSYSAYYIKTDHNNFRSVQFPTKCSFLSSGTRQLNLTLNEYDYEHICVLSPRAGARATFRNSAARERWVVCLAPNISAESS